MKRLNIIFSCLIIFSFVLNLPITSSAQQGQVRKSLNASITQRLGLEADITITYCRPGVKGRKIYGDIVPYGLAPGNKYSDDKPFPWRAGANENTTIDFNKDVLIEGSKLPAGKYGIHMIPSETDWIIIFSKNNSIWGSYKYNKEEDALRVSVTPVKAPHQEWLVYGFSDLSETSAVGFLHWEKLKIPFKIELVAK